jgi:CheY-like chemotaxis protein
VAVQTASSVQNRGVLTALRAAAIVIVATGLNDVIAGAAPRYEPLYAYLAAIALVVLLDGVILGAFAGILSIAFYALLFLPRASLLAALPFPSLAAVLTIVVAAAVRALLLSRQRVQPVEVIAEPVTTPLLPPAMLPIDNTEVLNAIDDLRDELRSAVTEISSAREREELLERTFLEAREALVVRLRVAEEEARAKDADLRRQLDAERAAFEVARNEALALAAEEAALAKRVEELEAANATDRTRAAAIIASHERRIADLNGDAEQLRVALDAERSRALRLSAEVAAERERVNETHAERTRDRAAVETARSEIEKLQRMLTAERATAAARSADAEAATRQAAEAASARDSEQAVRERLERELAEVRREVAEARRAIADEQSARDTAERDLAAARAAREEDAAALHDSAAKERTARETAEQALTAAREEHDRVASELQRTIEAEKSVRESFEQDAASARAQHEREIGDLRAALEAERIARETAERALASAREQAQSSSDTDRALDAERTARETAERALAAAREDHEREAGELRSSVESLERELASAREQHERDITELRIASDTEKQARESAERELMTAREQHEREVAELQSAIEAEKLELETERGEAVARATDLATLRRELDVERVTREQLEREVNDARRDIALLETRLVELDALRASAEGELKEERAAFDDRLNTIVTHLAQDHEADLGKAVLEREEARAEARSATAKLGKLQARIDDERQGILARLRDADERYKASLADANHLLAETRAAAQKEIERLHLRIAELQQEKQAAQAAQPLPPTRGRVLIAHPDPDMRATARASLERAGYEIVSAADGLEALRTAIAQKPDVVIADAVMPKMNGRELCQLLKSQEKTAHIRVILLTRASDDLPKGDIPPDLLLRKPVPLETLKSTLAELVTRA